MSEQKNLDANNLRINVKVVFGGKEFKGMIDPQENFIPDILCALRNGKDPVDALSFLASVGGAYYCEKNLIGASNRLGRTIK